MRGDFKEVFDLRKLTERQIGEIEFILNSPAYDHSFKPYMLGILHTLNRLWKDRTRERQDKYPDEFLAGGATFGEGLLEFFDRIITETSMERIHSAMANASNDDLYTMKQRQGLVRPVIGLDQQVLPDKVVDPAEDY